MANGQILISLLFGDKLNNDNIEFGLDGGISLSNLSGLEGSEFESFLNVGLYFDIKLKSEPWKIHTGLLLASTMGAGNIMPYSLNDPPLDALFEGGSVVRKLSYFNAPLTLKYTVKKRVYAEAGVMLGLLYRGEDTFTGTSSQGNDLAHVNDVRNKFHPLDAGLLGGIGYRIWKGYGMNIAVRYYHGLVDIEINDSADPVSNRTWYFNVGIPIGVGKAQANAAVKKQPTE
jgi:hypothetical protein